MNLAIWLDRAGAAHGDFPAVAIGDRVFMTYDQLAERAARLAGGFTGPLGLKPDDRVALISENSADYLECLFGIWHAGAVAVPANAKLHGRELAFLLEDSGARICLVSAKLADQVREHLPETVAHLIVIGGDDYDELMFEDPLAVAPRAGDDMAWLFYTSGTTGKPKGAMLSHRNLQAMTMGYLADVDEVRPGDTILHAAPMSHGSGLYALPHICNLGINVIPESGGFDPAEIYDLLQHWDRVAMFAAPTMVRRLMDHETDLGTGKLKNIIYGGGPMYVADAELALRRFGPKLTQIYGQGESPMTITVLTRHVIGDERHVRRRERLASVGLANSMVEVAVMDDTGDPLPPEEVGEICVRGDAVMLGYWKNAAATEKTIRAGWLRTGDMGCMDMDGFITLKDRSKDVIISGGSNIYPREVEECLLTHPDVHECSVIGRADPEWGEIVVAYVVGSADEKALDAHCIRQIARFKRPKAYIYVENLPKNNYGKILKTELRQRDQARSFP
ncbi:AMP-binding protein [Aestuariispira insulae]|uniref:Long-chain acyl-CoA synthetase n=1 Tax=Aestuariispira insulae TaxID=1461337 RepID=A0A3D9HKD5_9PROT|nr:AMP-binding protein [Aestuariispira insulae]RED49933.1 long-chain acyl-CoA synthetase [Aestuariispira insulae]